MVDTAEKPDSLDEEQKYYQKFKDMSYRGREFLYDHRKDAVIIIIVILLGITVWGLISGTMVLDVMSLISSTLLLGSIYLCMSLGLTMTYKLIGFANFAHAEFFVVGAYVGIGWSIWSQSVDRDPQFHDIYYVIILAFIIAGIIALVSDHIVFKPLRKQDAAPETLMITSIGLGIVLRNIISLFFGGRTLYFRWVEDVDNLEIPTVRFGGRLRFGIDTYNMIPQYIITILVTALTVGVLMFLLQTSKTGKALRATSDNKDLAESSGIDTDRMIQIVWFVGGGLAGIAGALFGSSFGVVPFTGFLFLLPAFAVVVFAGVGSIGGSILAAYIIAFSQNLSVSYLSGIERFLREYGGEFQRTGLVAYQIVVPFFVIIFVLLFKPYGLYGEPEEN